MCVDAARKAADEVFQLALDAHLRVKRRLGVDAPAPALMGQGKTELIARITELAGSENELGERRGIAGAVRVLAHVVSVLEDEALSKRQLHSLRPSTAFSPKVVDWAMAQTGPGQSGEQRALAMLNGGGR